MNECAFNPLLQINMHANAIDDNPSIRWSRNSVGSWIRPGLGAQNNVSSADIAWHAGNLRQNNLVMPVSTNAAAFANVFSGKSSGTTTSPKKNMTFKKPVLDK